MAENIHPSSLAAPSLHTQPLGLVESGQESATHSYTAYSASSPTSYSKRLRGPVELALELNITIQFNRVLAAITAGELEAAVELMQETCDLTNQLPEHNEILHARCRFWEGVLLDAAGEIREACASFLGALGLVGWRPFESKELIRYLRKEWDTVCVLIDQESGGDHGVAQDVKESLLTFIIHSEDNPQSASGQPSPWMERIQDSPALRNFGIHRAPTLLSSERTTNQAMEVVSKQVPETYTSHATQTENIDRQDRNTDIPVSRQHSHLYRQLQQEIEKGAAQPQNSPPPKVNNVEPALNTRNQASLSPDQVDLCISQFLAQIRSRGTHEKKPRSGEFSKKAIAKIHQPEIPSKCSHQPGSHAPDYSCNNSVAVKPETIILSDTLSPTQLDDRIEDTIGRRKSEGAVLPSPLPSRPGIDIGHEAADMLQIRRASTAHSPLSPVASSPLRKMSFPGDDMGLQ